MSDAENSKNENSAPSRSEEADQRRHCGRAKKGHRNLPPRAGYRLSAWKPVQAPKLTRYARSSERDCPTHYEYARPHEQTGLAISHRTQQRYRAIEHSWPRMNNLMSRRSGCSAGSLSSAPLLACPRTTAGATRSSPPPTGPHVLPRCRSLIPGLNPSPRASPFLKPRGQRLQSFPPKLPTKAGARSSKGFAQSRSRPR